MRYLKTHSTDGKRRRPDDMILKHTRGRNAVGSRVVAGPPRKKPESVILVEPKRGWFTRFLDWIRRQFKRFGGS